MPNVETETMRVISTLWLTENMGNALGVVTAVNKDTEEVITYIGVAKGDDEERDIRRILRRGGKLEDHGIRSLIAAHQIGDEKPVKDYYYVTKAAESLYITSKALIGAKQELNWDDVEISDEERKKIKKQLDGLIDMFLRLVHDALGFLDKAV